MTDVGDFGVTGVAGFAGVTGVAGFFTGVNAPTTDVMALPASAAAAASVAAFVIASLFDEPVDVLGLAVEVGGVSVAVPDPADVIGVAGAAGATTDVMGFVVASVVGVVTVGAGVVVAPVGFVGAGEVDPPVTGIDGFEITLVRLRLGFKYSVFRFFCKFAMSAIFFFRSRWGCRP
jgi:hypothetical protein